MLELYAILMVLLTGGIETCGLSMALEEYSHYVLDDKKW